MPQSAAAQHIAASAQVCNWRFDKAKAWREGADCKEARKIGDKYAKFRAFFVEGFAQ